MFIYILSIFIALIFPLLLIITTLSISYFSIKDREKSSPFECGFDPKAAARLPFSTRFFLLTVIFLVFDIEIVLLLPIPISSIFLSSSYAIFIFLLILLIGLIHE